MIPHKKKPSILFVLAHPDDESYITGGTIAKYTSLGVNVILGCFSRGENGNSVYQINVEDSLGTIRSRELGKAALVLGIKKKYIFDFPDGGFSKVRDGEIEERIVFIIRNEKPDIVVTFHGNGITGHSDHSYISRETHRAFTNSGNKHIFKHQFVRGLTPHLPKKLYFWTMEKELATVLGSRYHGVSMEKISTVINTKDFVEKRVKAIKSHATQYKTAEFERREKLRRLERECYIRMHPPFSPDERKEQDFFDSF